MKIKISKSQWNDMGKKSDKMLFVKSNRNLLYDDISDHKLLMEGIKIFNESVKNKFKNPNSRGCKQYLMGIYNKRHSGEIKDIILSNIAIRNTSFPKEILVEILEKRNDSLACIFAAGNPSCPPFMLAKILSENKTDDISYEAFENPSCPPNARVKWYIDTKQIMRNDKFIDNIFRESMDKVSKDPLKYITPTKEEMNRNIKNIEEFWLDKRNKGEIDEETNKALETHLRNKKQ